jgi:hypothetical protein
MLPEIGQQIAVMYHTKPTLAVVMKIGADLEVRDELYPAILFFKIHERENTLLRADTRELPLMVAHEGIFWTADTTPEGLIALNAAFALNTEHQPPSWSTML